MDNPFPPPNINQIDPDPYGLRSFLLRAAAVFLYHTGWVFVGQVIRIVFAQFGAETPSHLIPDAELSAFQSFQRFAVEYCSTAFLLLSPPFCLVIWLLLKWYRVQQTRWLLLGLGLAVSPIQIVVGWLLFRHFHFR
jgi:hypothetical protein